MLGIFCEDFFFFLPMKRPSKDQVVVRAQLLESAFLEDAVVHQPAGLVYDDECEDGPGEV